MLSQTPRIHQPSSVRHGTRLSRGEWAVGLLTAAYMLCALFGALTTGNQEFVFYLVVMCVLTGAVVALHLRVGLSLLALWGLSFWGLAHMAGGLLNVPTSWPTAGESHVLYNLWIVPGWLKYDQLVHAYGFGLVTWICWQSLCGAARMHGIDLHPTPGLLVLSAAAGMGFGALNEVVEFAATMTLPGTNVGGYANTGWDLVANLAGCTLAALAIHLASPGHLPGSD
jgi:hypothetical protein